jgi:hypothetical protein
MKVRADAKRVETDAAVAEWTGQAEPICLAASGIRWTMAERPALIR